MGWGGCEISFCVCKRDVDRVYLGVLLNYLSCLLLTISVGYIFDDVLSYIGNYINMDYVKSLVSTDSCIFFIKSLYHMRLELLPDIIYVYILSRCSRSRHHSFFLFFWFVVAYCTQLLSQAMYNLMMATTMAETCSC